MRRFVGCRRVKGPNAVEGMARPPDHAPETPLRAYWSLAESAKQLKTPAFGQR